MKLIRVLVIMAIIAGAACAVPRYASAGTPVHVGIGIGIPAPVVAYPAPAYYPPPYYVAPAPVYGAVVVPPRYGYYHHRPYYYGHYRHGYYGHHR